MFQSSAFDIWRKEEESYKIFTFIKGVDEKLAGGLPLGSITELCGGPGMGKTLLCLQLCVNVQFPDVIGGLEGCAYYIDTNQGFSPFRLKEISEQMTLRFKRTLEKFKPPSDSATPSTTFNVKHILDNISYVYCCNYKELMETVLNLQNILKTNVRLKLIVIDSFSFVIRQLEDANLRTRIIYEILTELQRIALEYNVAIVVTNELTTRCYDNNWFVAPALGETFAHKINTRLIMSQNVDDDSHVMVIDKSVLCDKSAFRFRIKNGGIRSWQDTSST